MKPGVLEPFCWPCASRFRVTSHNLSMKESSAGEGKLGTPSCSFQQDESAPSQLSFSKPLLTRSLWETADPVLRDLHPSGLGVEGHFTKTGGETSTP